VKQIGRDLNVRYALEGSVQRSGNRMRVNAQLIEAETGLHLWAERFDKPIADLFDMQDEIVARLARTLSTQLVAAEAARAERVPTPDLCSPTTLSIQPHVVDGLAVNQRTFIQPRRRELRRCRKVPGTTDDRWIAAAFSRPPKTRPSYFLKR
jgi:hypothetical protein